MDKTDEKAPTTKRPAAAESAAEAADNKPITPPAKKPATATQKQLQQQIQQQLQQQLQAQLQAAAARGQQANITPEQIQAQAQAMVQAAAQAQAVVAAAKSRGDGLVPMNATQIAALSQIQAQAIVNARKPPGTPQQIQTQIQLQAQALVHAHTQAQIQGGIYKGDNKAAKKVEAAVAKATTTTAAPVSVPVAAAEPASAVANKPPPAKTTTTTTTTTATMETDKPLNDMYANDDDPMGPAPSSNSPEFIAQLNSSLNQFWAKAFEDIHSLTDQTEHDFKNHNDLPLARIKRIMKSDEDVRMISAEAPVLFAKACELFILDLSIRSWNFSQLHKRRTLQKEDVKEAIQKTDIFDFLVDVIH